MPQNHAAIGMLLQPRVSTFERSAIPFSDRRPRTGGAINSGHRIDHVLAHGGEQAVVAELEQDHAFVNDHRVDHRFDQGSVLVSRPPEKSEASPVDDGIAVLEGTVDSQREKKEAQQLAHVDGILGVNNRLEVRGAGK
jgi:hypothetical protein